MVELVWVQGVESELKVPSNMGTARNDQLMGCSYERLIELAGRVCYDSLGKGRSTPEYFNHIVDAGHLSVLEHCVVNVTLNWGMSHYVFCNRPGVWIYGNVDEVYSVDMNFRALAEYACEDEDGVYFTKALRDGIQGQYLRAALGVKKPTGARAIIRPPVKKWYSFYIECSRACANELIRHRWLSAVSQRSTRYVDESESDCIVHPLMPSDLVVKNMKSCATNYKEAYDLIPGTRKEKLGAARTLLPLGLRTSLIYTVREDQLGTIKKQRISPFADAEIRELVTEMVNLV